MGDTVYDTRTFGRFYQGEFAQSAGAVEYTDCFSTEG